MNPPDSFSQTSPAPSSPQQTSPKGMWVLFAIIMLAAFAFTIYTVFFSGLSAAATDQIWRPGYRGDFGRGSDG
jgi:hypothetical protein